MMIPSDKYISITAKQDSDLVNYASSMIADEWPEFMLYDPAADYMSNCYRDLPEYQFVIVGADKSKPLAIGNSIPLEYNDALDNFPETGWDWVITKGIEDHSAGAKPNIMSALQVLVFGENKGQGISSFAVKSMIAIGKSNGYKGMIAPVRPTYKSRYPLTPIEDYIRWQDDSGLPFDPWLRVHKRLGAKIIKPCHKSMRITGTVSEWESRTGMKFPQSGEYIIPGALVPVTISREEDRGVYMEPNVWMWHEF